MLTNVDRITLSGQRCETRVTAWELGSISSRECLDAPAILATFTAGRTGLVACIIMQTIHTSFAQPRLQGLLLVQNGGRRNPWSRLPKWLQKFVRILSRKHDEMSSFCLNNGFRLYKTNRAARRWKQRPKKPFHHVSRDRILHDSWSISAAFLRPPF